MTWFKQSQLLFLAVKKALIIKQIRTILDIYKDIDANRLRDNLIYFLGKIISVAENYGIKMVIHPDDSLFYVLGLSRIVTDIAYLDDIFKKKYFT